MRIVSWNVNSLRARLDQVARLAREEQVDVLCLQETKVEDGSFPALALAAAGLPHLAVHGQKTYNGVALASRLPLEEVVSGHLLGEADPQARLIRARVGGVRLCCAYAPMGEAVGSPKYAYKLDWYARLREELGAWARPDDDLLLVGDLNVAPGDLDVWDAFALDGAVLCSARERAALAALQAWGLTDAYRHLSPRGRDYTWWDYRGGGFARNRGMRIDLALCTAPLLARVRGVRVVKAARGWEQASDHAPVVVELD